MKKTLITMLGTKTRKFIRACVFPAVLLFSIGFTACDSTKEVTEAENADPDVEVSDATVTDPDTSATK